MRRLTLMLIPDDTNRSVRQFYLPSVLVKVSIVLFFIGVSALVFLATDYAELVRLRSRYIQISTENNGLRGEARLLMSNLDEVKQSLKRVEDYTLKLGEMTQMRVDKVSQKTGIGPLSPEEYTSIISDSQRNNTSGSRLPLGIDLENLVFRQVFNNLSEVGKLANNQALELQQLLSTLSQQKSLLSSIPSANPVNGWITSGFGKRISPFTGQLAYHKGIDIASPIGTPIRAPAEGVVIFSGTKAGFGNFIMIAHGYGVVTRYGHNSQNMVQPGQRVKRGEQIASVGMTGRTTGPHLHYEVWVNGRAQNPKRFILDF